MSASDQDSYLAEMARVGSELGAKPIPGTRSDAEALIRAMRPQVICDARTHARTKWLEPF
jgi:uncharacterized protein (DUF2236 family)